MAAGTPRIARPCACGRANPAGGAGRDGPRKPKLLAVSDLGGNYWQTPTAHSDLDDLAQQATTFFVRADSRSVKKDTTSKISLSMESFKDTFKRSCRFTLEAKRHICGL